MENENPTDAEYTSSLVDWLMLSAGKKYSHKRVIIYFI